MSKYLKIVNLLFYGYSHGTQIQDTLIEKKEALMLLQNQQNIDEEKNNYIGFIIPEKEACLQFVRLSKDAWIIDIPIYSNDEYIHAQHAIISHRVALDIVETFFDAKSQLFKLLDQELYDLLFEYIEQQWHIKLKNIEEDLRVGDPFLSRTS